MTKQRNRRAETRRKNHTKRTKNSTSSNSQKQEKAKVVERIVQGYKLALTTGMPINKFNAGDNPFENLKAALKILREQGYPVRLNQTSLTDPRDGTRFVDLHLEPIFNDGRNRG